MKRFIVLTFLLMGWGYYELSGGADFVPQTRPAAPGDAQTAAADPATQSASPEAVELGGIEIVTRADNVTLAALTEPQTAADPAALVVPAADVAAVLQEVVPEIAPEGAPVIEVLAPAPAEPAGADLREVTGNRVNLREGPGRDFTAIDQLTEGTVIAVIATGDGGWVQIEVIATGQTGWMSADFLTAIDG